MLEVPIKLPESKQQNSLANNVHVHGQNLHTLVSKDRTGLIKWASIWKLQQPQHVMECSTAEHFVFNAGISGQPEGVTPGQPTGNPGAWQGICSKGMPHTQGIRALLRFWQNTPGPYPRDLHVICCLNVQRFSPQDKQARSIDILRQLSLSKLNSNSS